MKTFSVGCIIVTKDSKPSMVEYNIHKVNYQDAIHFT